MMAWGIVGCEVLCVVHGAEGREGGPWHAADPLPCCWALQESLQQFSHRADTGRAGQAHELHCIVSGMVLTLCPTGGPCSYLFGNRLSGPIPAELGNLKSCEQL